jgi:hypothetical protein
VRRTAASPKCLWSAFADADAFAPGHDGLKQKKPGGMTAGPARFACQYSCPTRIHGVTPRMSAASSMMGRGYSWT